MKYNELLLNINNIFKELGCFEEVIINDRINYKNTNGHFHRIDFSQSLGIIIESALNYEDAMNNLYEDSSVFSLKIGKNELIDSIKSELMEYYVEKHTNYN